MSQMLVYLPDELHRQVEEEGLPISEILQEALRAELARREQLAAIDKYLAELAAEAGEPSAAEDHRPEDHCPEDYRRADLLTTQVPDDDVLVGQVSDNDQVRPA